MIVYSRPIIGKDTEGNLKSLQLTGPERNLLQVYDGYNKLLLEKILHELKLLNFNINMIAENKKEKKNFSKFGKSLIDKKENE